MAKLTVTMRALKKAKKEKRLNQKRIRELPPNPGKGPQVKSQRAASLCNEQYGTGS